MGISVFQNEKPNQDTVETGADSQTELLRELLEDTDFENPLDYFDSQTVPSSPTDSEVVGGLLFYENLKI